MLSYAEIDTLAKHALYHHMEAHYKVKALLSGVVCAALILPNSLQLSFIILPVVTCAVYYALHDFITYYEKLESSYIDYSLDIKITAICFYSFFYRTTTYYVYHDISNKYKVYDITTNIPPW